MTRPKARVPFRVPKLNQVFRVLCVCVALSERGRLAVGRTLRRRFRGRAVRDRADCVHPLLIRLEGAGVGDLQILQGILDPRSKRCIDGLRGSRAPLVGAARRVHATRMCSITKTDNKRQGGQNSQLHGLLPARGYAIGHHGMKAGARGKVSGPRR